jgi:hypothetical protein
LGSHFLYRLRGPSFSGKQILSLNQLRITNPEEYDKAAAKYQGRETLMTEIVPGTSLQWTDFCFLSPINPRKLYQGLVESGHHPEPVSWFQIPVDRIGARALWYEQQQDTFTAHEFTRFDGGIYRELGELPSQTLEYFRETARRGERPFLFHLVPHVLVPDPIAIDGLGLVEWSE